MCEEQIGWKPCFWRVFRHLWVGMKLAQSGSKPCRFAQVFFSLGGSHLGQNMAPKCCFWSVFGLGCPQTPILEGFSAPPQLPVCTCFGGQQTVPFGHFQGPIWWVRCFPMVLRLVLVGGMWCISTKTHFFLWHLGPPFVWVSWCHQSEGCSATGSELSGGVAAQCGFLGVIKVKGVSATESELWGGVAVQWVTLTATPGGAGCSATGSEGGVALQGLRGFCASGSEGIALQGLRGCSATGSELSGGVAAL